MNTYYVPMDNDIPHGETIRYERKKIFTFILLNILNCFIEIIFLGMLKYYQWSPFILLFMALCFYFPRMLWRSLNNKSGLDIEKLVDEAMKYEQKEDRSKEREEAINHIVNSIDFYVRNRYVSSQSNDNKVLQKPWYYFTFWRHRHLSAYIVLLFTFVKLLFLINSLMQMFLLNAFLGNEYYLFGIEVIRKFIQGLDWSESKRFPRVTLCDFQIREIGILHRYTVQCVLPINLFNEKIFLILWFWILLVAAFNLGDFIAWLFRIVNVDSRSSYVRQKLAMSEALRNGDHKEWTTGKQAKPEEVQAANNFVRDYLQEDGCFALRLLARNGQDIIVGEVINRLYQCSRTEKDSKHVNPDRSIDHSSELPSNRHNATTSPHEFSGTMTRKELNNDHERQPLTQATSL